MMFRVIPSVVLAAGAVFGSSPLPAEEPPSSSRISSLGGRWVLNPELSDDAGEKMREAREGMRGGGSGGGRRPPGPGGGGGGRGGGMGGRPGSGRGGGDDRGWLRSLLEAPNEMTITPTEAEVVILERDGRMRIFRPDGKTHKSEGGTAEVKARWNAARLVVETKTERGPRARETYEAFPDGSKLTVTLGLEGGPLPPISIKRVYEPAAKEGSDIPGQAEPTKP